MVCFLLRLTLSGSLRTSRVFFFLQSCCKNSIWRLNKFSPILQHQQQRKLETMSTSTSSAPSTPLNKADFNRAYSVMQSEKESIDTENGVKSNNIDYYAQRLINAYIVGLFNVGSSYAGGSQYYELKSMEINGMPLTVRVANHPGYSDSGYKKIYGTAYMQQQPQRYVLSIEVVKDHYKKFSTEFKQGEATAQIILTNVDSDYRLDEALTYIDDCVSDLF